MKSKSLSIIIGALLTTACGMIDSSYMGNSNENAQVPQLYWSYNPVSNRIFPPCVQPPAAAVDDKGNGSYSKYQAGSGQVVMIKDISSGDFIDFLDAKGDVTVGGGSSAGFTVKGSAQFIKDNVGSNLSSTLTMISRVSNYDEYISVTPEFNETARKASRLNNSVAEMNICGNSYISKVSRGAYFVAVLSVEFESRTDKETFDGELTVDVEGVVNVKGEALKKLTENKKKIRVKYDHFQIGGNGASVNGAISSEDFAKCDGTPEGFEHCLKQFTAAMQYAKHSFPRQLLKKESMEIIGCGDASVATETKPEANNVQQVARFCYIDGDIRDERLKVMSFGTTNYDSVIEYTQDDKGKSERLTLPSIPLSEEDIRQLQDYQSRLIDKFYEVDSYLKRIKLLKKWQARVSNQVMALEKIEETILLLRNEYRIAIPICNSMGEGEFSPLACKTAYESAVAKSKTEFYFDVGELAIRPDSFADWCKLMEKEPDEYTQVTIDALMEKARTTAGNENISCIDAASALNGVTAITLTQAGNLEPLTSLPHLTRIDLPRVSGVRNVSSLAAMPFLEELDLSGLKLKPATSGVSDLKHLRRLRKINLSRNLLVDLGFLSEMPSLHTVIATDNLIQDVDSLAKADCKIKTLNLAGNKLTSVKSVMDNCKNLVGFSFDAEWLNDADRPFCSDPRVECTN